jgi:hypothetical protein
MIFKKKKQGAAKQVGHPLPPPTKTKTKTKTKTG